MESPHQQKQKTQPDIDAIVCSSNISWASDSLSEVFISLDEEPGPSTCHPQVSRGDILRVTRDSGLGKSPADSCTMRDGQGKKSARDLVADLKLYLFTINLLFW